MIEARIFLEGKQSLKMKSAAVALVHAQEVESSVMKILRDELKKILSKGSENQEEGEDVIDAESFSQVRNRMCTRARTKQGLVRKEDLTRREDAFVECQGILFELQAHFICSEECHWPGQ